MMLMMMMTRDQAATSRELLVEAWSLLDDLSAYSERVKQAAEAIINRGADEPEESDHDRGGEPDA